MPVPPTHGKSDDALPMVMAPTGLLLIGNPHSKALVDSLDGAIALLGDLGLSASLALSSEFIVDHVNFCKTAEKQGMDWIASPFHGLLTDATSSAWTDEAITSEAEAGIRLFHEVGLAAPIGLLLPNGAVALRAKNQLAKVNPDLVLFQSPEDPPVGGPVPGFKLVEAYVASQDKVFHQVGVSLDVERPAFPVQIQLVGLQSRLDSSWRFVRLGEWVNRIGNMAAAKRGRK